MIVKKLSGLIITIFISFSVFSLDKDAITPEKINTKDTAVALSEVAVVAQLKQKNNLRKLKALVKEYITQQDKENFHESKEKLFNYVA